MILNPLEEFSICRQLNDPNDSTTYYVRAFIRNAKTDALLATLNLEDKGSQRFTKTWQVPQDPTGLGFYITITTLVYTNSGYTTLSTTYGSEQHEFLIQDRINPFLGVASPDIDYKRIKKIVEEVIKQIPLPKDPEKFDYQTLTRGFERVITRLNAIHLPETDLRPIQSQLEAFIEQLNDLKALIEAIEIPHTNLSPLISAIEGIEIPNMSVELQDLRETIKGIKQPELEPLSLKLESIYNVVNADHMKDEAVKKKKARSRELLKEYLRVN